MGNLTIALSGELGSGKTSVSERVAGSLGVRRVSTGEAQRQIAEARGVSTLELNRQAESDPGIDDEVDSVFRSLASAREVLVVDSHLAWHFLPHAFKVHLVVDPVEAARRVLQRPGTSVERYRTLPEALQGIGARVESERRRFADRYHVDIFRLRNYDLVVDTTEASPDEVAAAVLAAFADRPPDTATPVLLLAPTRVRPTSAAALVTGWAGRTPDPGGAAERGDPPAAPVDAVYSRPWFFVVDGHRRLSAALHAGLTLLPATLLAEDDETVEGGATASSFRTGGPDPDLLRRWEDAHHLRFHDAPDGGRGWS